MEGDKRRQGSSSGPSTSKVTGTVVGTRGSFQKRLKESLREQRSSDEERPPRLPLLPAAASPVPPPPRLEAPPAEGCAHPSAGRPEGASVVDTAAPKTALQGKQTHRDPSLLHFRFRSAKAEVVYQISRYLEVAGFGVPSGHAPRVRTAALAREASWRWAVLPKGKRRRRVLSFLGLAVADARGSGRKAARDPGVYGDRKRSRGGVGDERTLLHRLSGADSVLSKPRQ